MNTRLFTKPVVDIFRKLSVEAVFLFGSQTGSYTWGDSDYDIAIFVTDKTKINTTEFLKTVIATVVLPEKIHLTIVDLYNTSPLLLYEIVKTGILLYEIENNKSNRIISQILHLYFDDQHRKDIFYKYLQNKYAT